MFDFFTFVAYSALLVVIVATALQVGRFGFALGFRAYALISMKHDKASRDLLDGCFLNPFKYGKTFGNVWLVAGLLSILVVAGLFTEQVKAHDPQVLTMLAGWVFVVQTSLLNAFAICKAKVAEMRAS